MSPRTLVVVNPQSRSGATRREFERLEPDVRDALGPVEVDWTTGPRDAERIARDAVRSGVERLIVAGGDGTTSEVATGLLAAGLGGQAEIGLLPLGTGGDLGRTLDLPRDPKQALARLATAKSRPVDAGRVEYRDRTGATHTSYFLNEAGVGVAGLICEMVNRTSKALGGRLSFLIGTVRGILAWESPVMSVHVDGELFHEGPLVLGSAANGVYFGGGMRVAPHARLDDGLLEMTVVEGTSKRRLLTQLPSLYAGRHLDLPEVHYRRGRRLEARLLKGTGWLEVDGEPLGGPPVTIEVLPGAISMLSAAP